jgi:DNA-directed RNA polymerase subunit RPC12/RpoP
MNETLRTCAECGEQFDSLEEGAGVDLCPDCYSELIEGL